MFLVRNLIRSEKVMEIVRKVYYIVLVYWEVMLIYGENWKSLL